MDGYRDRDQGRRRRGDRETDFDRWMEADRGRQPEGPQWDRPMDERFYDRGPQYDQGGYRRGTGTGFDYEERYAPGRARRDEGFDHDDRHDARRERRGRPDWGHEGRFERGRYAGTNTFDPGYGDSGYDEEDRGYGSRGDYGRAPGAAPGGHRGERVYGGNASGNLMRGPHTGRGPKGYQRSDDRIMEDVCERLTHHGHLDPSDIHVSVKDSEVTLEGTVRTREEKRLADQLAHTVTGVWDVHNRLTLENSGRSEDREENPRNVAQPETSANGVD